MYVSEIIGKRIKILRKEHELTQVALCEAINITQSTLTGYETGKRTPTLEVLFSLADYFNVSLDYLVGRTDTDRLRDASLTDGESSHLETFRQLSRFNQEIIIGKTNELLREQRLVSQHSSAPVSKENAG